MIVLYVKWYRRFVLPMLFIRDITSEVIYPNVYSIFKSPPGCDLLITANFLWNTQSPYSRYSAHALEFDYPSTLAALSEANDKFLPFSILNLSAPSSSVLHPWHVFKSNTQKTQIPPLPQPCIPIPSLKTHINSWIPATHTESHSYIAIWKTVN